MKKLCFVVALGLVAVVAEAGERLTGDELKAFYTDTTISGVHFKLGPGKTYYASDGTVESTSDSGKVRAGKWWIEGSDKRCIRWNGRDKDFCHYTERNDDGTHTLIHGKKGKELVKIKSMEKGNRL